MLARDLDYLQPKDTPELPVDFDCEGKMLRSLQQSLKARLIATP